MLTNLTRFVQLTSRLTQFKPDDIELHDALIATLTAPTSNELRVQDIFNWRRKTDFGSSEYWATAFEALVIGYNDNNAHNILRRIEDTLSNEGNEDKLLYSIPVIIGLLQAANWIERYQTQQKNGKFDTALPAVVGALLRNYAATKNDHVTRDNPEERERFSSAFSVYCSSSDRTLRNARLMGVSHELIDIEIASPHAQKIMGEISRTFMYRVGIPAALNAFADHFRLQACAKVETGFPGQVIG